MTRWPSSCHPVPVTPCAGTLLPATPDFTSIQDILSLPNYNETSRKFRLHSAPLAAEPDPHGHYARGEAPRRCLCHAHLWAKPQDPHRIALSPLWQRALEKAFRIKLPTPLQLARAIAFQIFLKMRLNYRHDTIA